MDYNLLSRTAKLVALFGFFLPWVTVSCSGTELASATGLQLMTGHIQFHGPLAERPPSDHPDPEAFAILAFALIALGFTLSVFLRRRAAAAVLLAFALAGAGSAAWSMRHIQESAARAAQSRDSEQSPVSEDGSLMSERAQRDIERAVARMIQVEERPGYWTTLLALMGAAGLAGLSLASAAPLSASGSPPNNRSPGSPPDHTPPAQSQ